MKENPRSSRSSNSGRSQGPPNGGSWLVGRVGRAVGLKGEVELFVLSDAPERFAPGSVLSSPAGDVTLRSHRTHGERVIVAFEEVTDRNGAEALTGAELRIDAERARPLDEGEYWDHDLIGCEVVTLTGEQVGEVTDVLHQPTGEILVVTAGGREHLIPLVGDIVKDVSINSRITIDPLPGLIE